MNSRVPSLSRSESAVLLREIGSCELGVGSYRRGARVCLLDSPAKLATPNIQPEHALIKSRTTDNAWLPVP